MLYLWIVFLFLGLKLGCTSGTGLLETSQRCTYHRIHKMYGAHCSQMNLPNVPNVLKSNIEILDLSVNRIRELRSTSFKRYTSIRFLYLSDNSIQIIHPSTFDPLSSLETLDLTLNSLTTIPTFILNLPNLRKLYMSENALINLNNDLAAMEKPIKAPLAFLNISMCKLTEFPDFGLIPTLEYLNVSQNEFKNFNSGQLTGFCGLKTLDISMSLNSIDNKCVYRDIYTFFVEMDLNLVSDAYSLESDDETGCQPNILSDEEINKYNDCKLVLKTKEVARVAKKTWIIVACSIGGVVMISIMVLYILHRRNVNQTKRNMKKLSKKQNLHENTGSSLLDNNA